MRHLPKKSPPVIRKQYRVRFTCSEAGKRLLDYPDILTAHPGIINDRPRADKVLLSLQKVREAWLEVRLGYDGDWEKL